MAFLITRRSLCVKTALLLLRVCVAYCVVMAVVYALVVRVSSVRFLQGTEEFLWVQHTQNMSYVSWLWNMLRGEWGVSWVDGRPVWDWLKTPLLRSLLLGISCEAVASVGAYVCACLWGVGSIKKHAMRLSLFMGMVPLEIFAWCAIGVCMRIWVLQPLVLTGFSLLAVVCGSLPKMFRWTWVLLHETEQVYGLPYVTTAFAKGLSGTTVALRHVGVSILPVWKKLLVSDMGQMLASLLVLEMVFSVRGVHYVMWEALSRGDIPVAMGAVSVMVCVHVLCVW